MFEYVGHDDPEPPAKLGRHDPAYIPPTPTALLKVVAKPGRVVKFERISARELEEWVEKAPGPKDLGHPNTESFYDNTGRLAAKWALEHVGEFPEDIHLGLDGFWRAVEHTHPRIQDLEQLTYYPRYWAWLAVNRIFDAHRWRRRLFTPRG